MALRRIEIARFPVPFRRPFSHASAIRTEADNVIVRALSDSGVAGYGEGCPRSYVTGETAEGARQFLTSLVPHIGAAAASLDALRTWIADNKTAIDRNPAAFAALELALLDMISRERELSIEALLDLPPVSRVHRYTAVIGDAAPGEARRLWLRYRLFGLRDFKVKLSGDAARDHAKLAPFRLLGGQRLRLDANNLWRRPQDCLAHLRSIRTPAFAIEEPLAANDLAGCREIALATGIAIVLDETFLSPDALAMLPDDVTWIVNLRVSKLGGLLRSLEAVKATRERGLGIIVGAHVGETGLLTRAALPVARAAGDSLVAQEGAFGERLLARDLTRPSPRFGFGGRFSRRSLPAPDGPGLGLDVDRALLADVQQHDVEGARCAP